MMSLVHNNEHSMQHSRTPTTATFGRRHDTATRNRVKRRVDEFRDQNYAETRSYSEYRLRELARQGVARDYPELSGVKFEAMVDQRLARGMRPHRK